MFIGAAALMTTYQAVISIGIKRERSSNINKTVKRSLLVGGVVSTVGLASLASVGMAAAATDNSSSQQNLVDKIAQKFNVNKDDVQKVFDEDRAAHEAEHEKAQAERLQKLVDNGTITAAQKTAIEAKLKELKAERQANKDEFKNLSEDQRKAKMDEKRTELESWAKEQGLDLSKLRGVFRGPGGHGGPGGPHGPEDSQQS
jgi:hypothetical protein